VLDLGDECEEGGSFSPNLVISVVASDDTNSEQNSAVHYIPAIIVENGTVDASFREHTDSTKVLAETRMASTSTLRKFDAEKVYCYGVVNGGSKMSVVMMTADYDVLSARTYKAVFLQYTKGEKFTLEYTSSKYKEITALFVAIYIHIGKLKKLKPRDQPGNKMNKNLQKAPKDSPSKPKKETLRLENRTYTVEVASPTIRYLTIGINIKYIVKVRTRAIVFISYQN
jgi:hypothetical protein